MLSVAQTAAWNDKTISEYSIGLDVEGSDSGLERSKKVTNILSQCSLFPGRDLIPGYRKYEA
jgi:hypothetical protein